MPKNTERNERIVDRLDGWWNVLRIVCVIAVALACAVGILLGFGLGDVGESLLVKIGPVIKTIVGTGLVVGLIGFASGGVLGLLSVFSEPNTTEVREAAELAFHGEVEAAGRSSLASPTHNLLSLGALADLYSKQIESYQTQTRNRANLSFYYALIAMLAGLVFVAWGGLYLLTSSTLNSVAAGTSLAAIGGVVSAYLTRTFLSIHRLSVEQLNTYFNQPVINDHVVNAQRVAELVADPKERDALYRLIVLSLLSRVDSARQVQTINPAVSGQPTPPIGSVNADCPHRVEVAIHRR